jgi:hypothetical protein
VHAYLARVLQKADRDRVFQLSIVRNPFADPQAERAILTLVE